MGRIILSAALSLVFCGSAAHAALIGPTPYLQSSDSPFDGVGFGAYFHLEDFEDALLNVPGVTASSGGVTSVVFGPAIHDSVDADDGLIDGSGLGGDSWFSNPGVAGVTWTFNEGLLGALPTHAGVVWTDGAGDIMFEAFDKDGLSLGTVVGMHADGSVNGETAEDRFYGVIDLGGISAIKLSNQSGGIELDHLQYGAVVGGVPEPATALLLATTLIVLCHFRKRKTAAA